MNKKIKKFLAIILLLLVAVTIILVSISRASLEIMLKDQMEGKLRTEELIIDDEVIYKFPQSWVQPDNMKYLIKEVRSWIWEKFSFNEEEKIDIALILADKKMAESIALLKKEKYNLAIDTSIRAVEKLKYADKLTNKLENKIIKSQKSDQIQKMTEVYFKIIEEMGDNDKIDEQKYLILLQNINEFKEKKTQ